MSTATVTAHPDRATTERRPRSRADDARYSHLFEELKRPAKGMVRQAFGSAFSDDELDDLYSSAWLSTLAAFDRNPRRLTDPELRRYLMTAVANQAGREMRRRGRKPTVSLELAAERREDEAAPDEAAVASEQARVTREVLASLPPRRRAVLVYRYGWDLEPSEVCELVEGLSPRAYRKEIERGVAEVAKKMRLVEEGGWCESREPLLRSVAAGVATDDEERQARHHLANCRRCTGFVARLNDHLHDLGTTFALAAALDGGAAGALTEAGASVLGKAKQAVASLLGRGSDVADQTANQLAAAGGTKGAGAAGAGALAKLAGAGAVPKLVTACLGTGAAATACVAAGVVPGVGLGRSDPRPAAREARAVEPDRTDARRHAALPLQQDATRPAPEPGPPPSPPASGASPPPQDPPPQTEPAPQPPPEPEPPPPTVQEFEPVGTPAPGPAPTASSGGSGGGGGSSGTASGSDFGP